MNAHSSSRWAFGRVGAVCFAFFVAHLAACSSPTSDSSAIGAGGASPGASVGGTASGGASSPTGGTNAGSVAIGGTASAGGAMGVSGSATGGSSYAGGSSNGGTGVAGASGAGAGGSSGASANSGGTSAGGVGGSASGAGAGGFPPLPTNLTVHVAGDSTAAIFPPSDGRVGWAAVFQQFFTKGVTVDDAARSGRSTKSFIDEGWWKMLKATIKVGDYVFIEFAHNDEKSDEPTLYTDPATTFRTNLKLFISDTRSAGGVPILLTPTSRADFSGNKIVQTHGAYPAAVLAVGQETQTPVIDMTEKTRIWLESLGPTAALPYYAPGDTTHTSAKGAPEIAKLVVQGIRELGLPLAQRLVP